MGSAALLQELGEGGAGLRMLQPEVDRGFEIPQLAPAIVAATVEAVGDDVELMADANCLMKLDTALRWCKAFEPYNLTWLEEPIVHNDPHLLAQLRKQTHIPIAAGQWENFWKAYPY